MSSSLKRGTKYRPSRKAQKRRPKPAPQKIGPLHRQVVVTVRGGLATFEVDAGIAPLVVALNERGYETTTSCESFPDARFMAWIGFASLTRAERFCDLIGGVLVVPREVDRQAAREADCPWDEPAAGVAFAPSRIAEVLRLVEGK